MKRRQVLLRRAKKLFLQSVTLSVFLGSPHGFAAEGTKLGWGADAESGAPFSFKDPQSPTVMKGFEAEIVAELAKRLGREIEFKQNNWEGLVEGLKRGDCDFIVNGLEITEDRARVVRFSRPYYITAQVIAVRREVEDVSRLEDLEGKRVGSLAGSLAQRMLAEADFPLQVVTYGEEIHAYQDLAWGRLDAVFLDEPIAIYYAKTNPRLKIVGEPIGRMEYGVAVRLEDGKLAEQIDRALAAMIQDGSLRRILERWGLWNQLTAQAWSQSLTPETPPVEFQSFVENLQQLQASQSWSDRWDRYAKYAPMLARGAWMTLKISVTSMLLAILVGVVVSTMRLYGPKPIRWVAIAFVEVFRGTPLLIQLFLIFYGLPRVGIEFSPFVAAILGLGLNYGACEAENYRAGVLSVHSSQVDAARALGMNLWQRLRHVIWPQAARLVLPPMTNDFIALLKDSSLVSVITMVELTSTYGQLASASFDYLGLGLLVAGLYFLLGLPFVQLARKAEAWVRRESARV